VERFLKRLDWLRFVTIALLACVIATPTTALPGDLDTTFNSTGSFGPFAITSGDSNGRAMALQPDGRIIVAGYCEKSDTNSDTDFCALRLNRDGTLDTSFTGPGGTAAGFFTVDLGDPIERLVAVRLQSDGKIVLAGTCGTSGTAGIFCLARLNTNGSLDNTFDGPSGVGNGKFAIGFGSGPDGSTLVDMAIQSDDKIVVAGICRPSSANHQFCVARLNGNNGSYDASFDGPDSAGTGVGAGNGRFVRHIVSTSTFESLGALYIQSDGNIVLGGRCGDLLCMMRLLASNGSFDPSFDGPASAIGNGRWAQDITFCTFSCQVRGIAEGLLDGSATDRALVIAVYNNESGSPSYRIALLRMSAGGWLRNIPGDDGRPLLLYPFYEMTRLIERANDRLVLGAGGQAVVARFTPSLSSGWGAERGIARALPDSQQVRAILQQPDGRVVVLGTSGVTSQIRVTRLEGGPYDCPGDFDGDGRVLATVDSLIGTRVALGMNTSTVIAGINFPPGATRTTWPAIRDYMIQNCGFGQLQ
jgi:uncharacterized delta-60 repeat protein